MKARARPDAAPGTEVVRVASDREVAHAALVLGEQRAWLEWLSGHDLAEVDPGSRDEYANLRDWYAPPDGALLLARLDGEPVGVIALRRMRHDVAEIKRLYVRPRARGLDLGRRLVREAMRAARQMGMTRAYLETAPGLMPTAVRLYRELGFSETRPETLSSVEGVIGMQRRLDAVAA